MTELERALLAVGQNLEVPAAPDLTGAVRARLAEGRRPSLFSRRVLVVALAVLYSGALSGAVGGPGPPDAWRRPLRLRRRAGARDGRARRIRRSRDTSRRGAGSRRE